MGNTQQRMATTSAKMKTSTSMQTTPKTKTSTSHLAHSTTTYDINDKHRYCSSQASNQRNETGGGCVPATKCFSNNKPTTARQPMTSFRHRLLHKWRKNILKTSQTHLDDLNTAARVCGSSAASLTNRNRSTTDQNLFIIQDNFVEFIESNDNNDKDMVDLNVEENQDQLTIDSKLLRDVNQKLNAIASNDSDTETEHLEADGGKTTNMKKLTKSPAIFNISQYTNNVESNHKDTVKDFFNDQPITSSDSYDDSLSESSVGENFEEYEKRHGGGGMGIRKTSHPISNSTTSSISSVSSISSFTSSHSSLNVQRTMPPPQTPSTTTTATKNCTNRLKNLLPKLKLKLRKTNRNTTAKLNDDDDDETRMMNFAPTDAQLYSFKERFEIKEDDPHIDDLESLCFIDETSSYSLSSSSLVFVPLKTNENPPPPTLPPSHDQQQSSAALKFLNQVNKRLNFYRLKKQAKALHVLNSNMDSVSNRVSLDEEKENVAIFDDRTIEKIINKENNYFDYNDNNNNGINDIMIIDDDYNDSNSDSVNIKAHKPNINEVNSIARLKVNAPLASSEHTTPLSRSIDYLNRLDHFKIILNNTNNNNNNTRNQHVTSNVSATLPIKKYYRLCNNTSVFNSPNR